MSEVKISLIDSSVEEIKQEDLLKHIELCGRVCYKSEDKITEDSAEKFIRMLVNRGHTSVLEHGTVYLESNSFDGDYGKFSLEQLQIRRSPYTFYSTYDERLSKFFATTNFRVIVQAFSNDLDKALQFVRDNAIEPTHHIRRRSFRFTCDRGVSHELVRHRVISFSQESTRYVNSTKRGFVFIRPAWWSEVKDKSQLPGQLSTEHTTFTEACQTAAEKYSQLINLGQTPQQARAVLPNALKTEVVITATEPQWEAFLQLRDNPAAHPDMQILAKQLKELLKNS